MRNIFLSLGLLGVLILHFIILKNITFTAWPEMFSYPYLVNNSYLIYKDFAHPYVPLLTFILAFYYKAAGMNLLTHQYFTWGLILFNDFLIFLICLKILKKSFSLFPVIVYVFLQPIFEGNMLWFDLGTTPFILGFFAVFLYIKDLGRRLFWAGFLLALALLIKQQVIVLVVLISFIIIALKENRKYFQIYLTGLFIPVFFSVLILATLKVLKDYFFWTLEFPLVWLPKFPGYAQIPGKKDIFLLVVLFGLPLIFLISKYRKVSAFTKFLTVSIFASIFMAFPRFSYFHLQPALAVIVVFYALILKDFKKIAPVFILVPVLAGLYLWKDYRPFIGVEDARFYDNQDLELASFVKANSTVEDRIYFIGPHSLLFSLSDRLPSHPWIENYVWHFEIPGLQENQVEGFKREENLVIFKQGFASGNWYDLGVYQPKKILEYINQDFDMIEKNADGVEVWKRKKVE